MAHVTDLIAKYTAKQLTLEVVEPAIAEASDKFNELVYELWKSLMTLEMQLFEQCEVRSFRSNCL